MPLKRLVVCLNDFIVASESKKTQKAASLIKTALNIYFEIEQDSQKRNVIANEFKLMTAMVKQGDFLNAITKAKELRDIFQNAIAFAEDLKNKILNLKKSGRDPSDTAKAMSPFQLAIGGLCYQNWMMQDPGVPGSRLNLGMIKAFESGLKGESISNLAELEACLETYQIEYHLPLGTLFDFADDSKPLLKRLINESKEVHKDFEDSANRKLSKKLSIAWLILNQYCQNTNSNISDLIENSLFFEAMVALSFETGLRCHFESPALANQMGNEPLAL